MMEDAMVGSMELRRLQEGRLVLERQVLLDGEIIDSVRKGDREAYRAIIDRYRQRAYRIALGLVGNPQDALDVSQDAFIKTYRSLKAFDTRRPFFPWFYRILRNLCLDHMRRSRRRREVPITEALMLADDPRDGEMRRVLWEAVEALAVEQREVIIFHYFEGLSYKEMASALGKPMGTIMSTLYYARRQLREALKGRWPGSERGEREHGS